MKIPSKLSISSRPFPTFPSHSNRNMSKEVPAELWHEFCAFTESAAKLTNLLNNPSVRWRGNQLWWLNRTPRADRKSKGKSRKPQKKIIPFQPSDKLEENLDRNMIKNYKKIDDRMELKIMQFNYIKWINKNYVCIGHTVMRLIIQYFWEINNLFDSVGYRIAINKIWIHCTKFPSRFHCSQKPGELKSTEIEFEFHLSSLSIDTRHWHDSDQEIIKTKQTRYLSIMIWFWEIKFEFRL